MILLCVDGLADRSEDHERIVEIANELHRAGRAVTVLTFLSSTNDTGRVQPTFPIEGGVCVLPLQTVPADGGRLLHRNFHPAFSVGYGDTTADFTANQLAALRQLGAALTADDTIVFTTPLQAEVFHHALEGDECRAREVGDEEYRTELAAGDRRRLLGPGPGTTAPLTELFPTVGGEPVPIDAISHGVRRSWGRTIHDVTVRSDAQLHDVLVDNGAVVRAVQTIHLDGATRITFQASGRDVISYTTALGSLDRHYLANTTADRGLEVLPHLRRDADYGDGTPPVVDTMYAPSGGPIRLTTARLPAAAARVSKTLARGVGRRLRRLTGSEAVASGAADGRVEVFDPIGPQRYGRTAQPGAAQPGAAQPAGAAASTATTLPVPPRGVVGMARAGVRLAASAVMWSLVDRRPGARREIARHPRYPVISGTDSFGVAINQPGAVTVLNSGTASRPTVTIRGEYDFLVLRDACSERRVAPPLSYGEFFDGICAAEREFGLFDITTNDGDHIWELGRTNLLIGHLGKSFGYFGAGAPIHPVPPLDVYTGPKRLMTAPHARRIVFGFPMRGGTDFRTAAFRDDDTMLIVPPEPDGYRGITDSNLVYPMYEYNRWLASARHRYAQLRVPEVDARPFEEALSKTLGIRIDLGTTLRGGLRKFLDEREFWTPVFEHIKPEEVAITQSHGRPGIAAAAARSGALVSDIQYALTSRYHPTYWFGETPRHGATRLYAWSDFWAGRTNAYREHAVVPRRQPELVAALDDHGDEAPVWDVCVVSQPSIFRRMAAFIAELLRERPELRVVIAPHPVQAAGTPGAALMQTHLDAAGIAGRVAISPVNTLATIRQSAMCLGISSTSMYEAVALNRPTYVIPAPSYEYVADDIASGLFRLATSPHDLVPFEVPQARRTIFGLE